MDRLSQKMAPIKLRFDAGFYSEDLLNFLESYPDVIYEIGVPQHQWLQAKIRQLSYRSYHNSERQYCSFAYGEGLDGAFIVTKALGWLSHLAFTLISMLRQIAFRREMKRYRLKRLRYLLFTSIGYYVHRARKRCFKIDLARIGPIRFHAMMQRIWAF